MKKPSYLLALEGPFFAGLLSLLCVNTGSAQNANFTADATSGCFPLTVKFTDTSTGVISSWEWDFGNGNTSALQNPGVIYTSPGTYTVNLKVSGSQTDTETKTAYIKVYDYPSVDFSFDKTAGCAPLAVKFTDKSTPGSGAITNWLWVFTDGTSTTSSSPVHIFTTAGDMTVSLKVTNSFGCARTAAKPAVINVTGPLAKFKASNTVVCQVPAAIQFTNESTGSSNLTYSWNFGDGATSTLKDPSHTYTTSGVFSVVLKVRDQQECETSHTVAIEAGSGGGLSFQPSAAKVCAGQSITFTSQADSQVLSREWDFGNNTSSTNASPSVTYPVAGQYTVKLTALLQGKTCESVVTKTVEVVALPVPSFTYLADCNFNVTFTNTSLNASRVEWFVQDVQVSTLQSFKYSFSFSGTRSIKLIAYNDMNCSEVHIQYIAVPTKPFAAFSPMLPQACKEPSLSGCAPFLLELKNISTSSSEFTSSWDFGDGSKSTDKEPSHTYQNKGTFTLSLTITNTQGCTSTTSAKVTVETEVPVAKFILDKPKVCAGEDVTFTNQSEKSTFWCWDFGDGMTFTGRDVKHRYERPGIYTVTLTAKNAGCQAIKVIEHAVEVMDPFVSFGISKNCVDPYTIKLQNLSENYHSLEWDFGDGTISTTNETDHHFSATGNYIVKLTGSNTTTGCVTVVSQAVKIQEIRADFEISNTKPCRGEVVKFTDKSEFATQWAWALGTNAFTTTQSPSHAFSLPGSHNIVLTSTDSDGCSDQKVLSLKVLDILGNFSYSASSNCNELAVQFTDLSTPAPAILSWLWDFGDDQTSSAKNPTHTYTALGDFTVNLTLTNNEGSCTFTREKAVLFTNPVPDFLSSKESACIDEIVTLTNLSSNAISFNWDFGDGRTANGTNSQIGYPAAGKYDITLNATDTYGCTRSLTKKNVITVTQPVADFDAFDTSTECPPLISLFRDKSTGDVKQWQWDFGNGTSSVVQHPAYTYLRPGTFDVTLRVTDVNGCFDTVEKEQLVVIGGPNGSFTSGVSGNFCSGQLVPFSATTTNTVNHRWDYGDGTVEDTGPKTDPQHAYTSLGSHSASLVLIDAKGCQVVAEGEAKIVINDTTWIDFVYLPECITQGESFLLQAETEESDIEWQWLIAGQPVGITQQLSTAVDSAGQYEVTLHALNQHGCLSTVSHTVPVQGALTFIPNVFTPNGDDYNPYFIIKGVEKSNWDIHVYNRYGTTVFEKENYQSDWDGGDAPAGVYYYILTNSVCKDLTYKGIVSIRR